MGPSSRHLRTTALSVGASVALVVAALSLPALGGPTGPRSAAAAPTDPPSGGSGSLANAAATITVRGVGTVTLRPDEARISLGTQAQAPTAAAAQSTADAVMARLVAAIRRLGVADKDLATQWLSLQPRYAGDQAGPSAPRINGYQADQSLVVTVRDLSKAGQVIDAAVSAGANSVSGIQFSVADPAAASAQARTAAMADARARAQALASAAGVSLGRVISISETNGTPPSPIPYAMAAPVAGLATQVEPGTTEVEVDLTVVFAIGS